MNPTQTLAVDIAAPFAKVVAELAEPMSHPSWATEFFQGPAEEAEGGQVRVNVPRLGGPCRMRIDAMPNFGIVDIYIASGEDAYGKPIPVRVIENGDGTTVLWTLSQFPSMPDDMFTSGCASMQKELTTLKSKLEAGA